MVKYSKYEIDRENYRVLDEFWNLFKHLPINSIYTRALMIAAEQKEIFWIFDLVRQQEANCLQGLFATIHIVAEE